MINYRQQGCAKSKIEKLVKKRNAGEKSQGIEELYWLFDTNRYFPILSTLRIRKQTDI